MERKVPLYPNLISIGNNVHLATKVFLIPHDAICLCPNGVVGEGTRVWEKIGCIEIGDNVFIGSHIFTGAGSTVNKDIPV